MNPIHLDFATAHAAKTGPRRFDDSASMTGFGELPQEPNFTQMLADINEADADEAFAAEIAQRGSDRWCDVMDEERALQRQEERAERIARGE